MPSITILRNAFSVPDSVRIIPETQYVLENRNRINQNKEGFQLDNTDNSDHPLSYRSQLGTPVYANIEFLPGQYETNTKGVFRSFGSHVDGPARLRYEAVLITVSQQKLIVKTQIQGRNGSVKEYIGMDDYQVTVNGILTTPENGNGIAPIDYLYELKKMLDAPIAIEVSSAYLNLLGINWLMVTDYQLEEDEGGYSYQKFSINFVSDEQQELELVNL